MTYKVIMDEKSEDGRETPVGIFARILESHEEMAPLKEMLEDFECRLAILMKEGELKLRGQLVAGLAALPEAQGAMKPLFSWMLAEILDYEADWIIVISADWWEEASDIDREALVFHEAMHCGQQRDKHGEPRFDMLGQPVVGILPHDVEEFHSVVRRYGAWTPDLVEFKEALTVGERSRKNGRDGSLSVSGGNPALKLVG